VTPAPVAAGAHRTDRDFWWFWSGQTVSNFGSAISSFVLALIVLKLTGSPFALGVAAALGMLPNLLFGLPLGALVDRVERRPLMIGIDLARAVLLGIVPTLAVLGALTVPVVYAVTFLSSTGTVAYRAAAFAAIPSLVPRDRLVSANGHLQASVSAGSIAGPLVAGLLAAFLRLELLVVIDSLSFLCAAVTLLVIRTRFNRSGRVPGGGILHDMAEGLRYVLGHPVLRAIAVMMALVNLCTSMVISQIVVYAKHQLAASDSQVGLLYSAGSAGVIVLSLAAGPLRRRFALSRVMLTALAASGLFTLGMALTRSLPAALLLWAAAFGCGALFNINSGSLRQAIVPDHLLGRVITVAQVLAWSVNPVASVAGGALIQWTGGVAPVFAVCGVLSMLIPLGFGLTAVGRAERYVQPAAEPAAGR